MYRCANSVYNICSVVSIRIEYIMLLTLFGRIVRYFVWEPIGYRVYTREPVSTKFKLVREVDFG